jgi:hypothetical protein
MGRDDEIPGSGSHRDPGHGQRFRQIRRAVIKSRQYMTMDIGHGAALLWKP